MGKYQKISYKLFSNERLKQTDFHGQAVYPLYIQLIYARQPTHLKSFYFDFFAQEKFLVDIAGQKEAPSMKVVETMEKSLMDFIIEHHKEDFSIELFHTWYQYYARDLITLLEDGFYKYLYTFFHDEGTPVFASLCELANGRKNAGLLIQDLKQIVKPALYKKIIDNAAHYAPPYLPLYSFANKITGDRTPLLAVKDWHQPLVQETLKTYLETHYPDYETDIVFEYINAIVGTI